MTVTSSNDPDEIRRDIDRTRASLAGDVDRLEDKVTPSRVVQRRVGRVREGASSLRDRVMGSVDKVTDKVTDTAHSTGGALSSATDSVGDAPDTVKRQASGNPVAAGLIAFGVGWLLGSVIGPSDQERRLAAEAKDRAQPALGEAAQHVVEQVKEPAQQAVTEVKESAADAARQVGEEAKSHASDVKDEAQGAVSDVRNS